MAATRATRVFAQCPPGDLQWVEPISTSDYAKVYGLDGSPRCIDWEPVLVRVVDSENRHPSRGDDDLLWLGPHALVIRDRALDVMSDELDGYGEFLELFDPVRAESLWLFHPYVCDVLDLDQSQMRCSADGLSSEDSATTVTAITHHMFKPDMVAGLAAFRLPQVATLYLSEDVVRAVRAAQLGGVNFSMVWDPVLSHA